MEASLLIEVIAGLVLVLGILIFILLRPKPQKEEIKVNITASSEPKKKTDLETLRHIIRNRGSSKEELLEAVDMIVKYHGKIPDKLGLRVNPQFDVYMEIFISLCRHRNATKEMILKLDRELVSKNPSYKSEINDAITKGLNSRG
jgi:hypothetical protein